MCTAQLRSVTARNLYWLFAAVLATILFGFYGFFAKLSTFQHPVISNLMIYVIAAVCGIIFTCTTKKKPAFSLEASLSGVASGVAALTALYAMVSSQVLVVFSLVSFASVIFFLIMWVCEKPKLSGRQKSYAVTGILVSVFGLSVASASTAGGISHLLGSAINLNSLVLGLVISVGFGVWAYLFFVAIEKKKEEISTAFFNYSFASLAIAIVAFPLFGLHLQLRGFSDFRGVFPIVAGLLLAGGDLLTLKAFEMTSGKSKIQETVVAILANAEIVPLIFISYFILKESTLEGFIGAFVVFVGVSILNYAEKTG